MQFSHNNEQLNALEEKKNGMFFFHPRNIYCICIYIYTHTLMGLRQVAKIVDRRVLNGLFCLFVALDMFDCGN